MFKTISCKSKDLEIIELSYFYDLTITLVGENLDLSNNTLATILQYRVNNQ